MKFRTDPPQTPIVRRQSFGGWKKSAIGPGTKAGGPNYLHALVDWADAAVEDAGRAPRPPSAGLLHAAQDAGVSEDDLAWLRAAFSTDTAAWEEEFGIARDASQLGIERNLLRYLPVPVTVRIAADASLAQTIRALGAGLAAGATPLVSSPVALPQPLVSALDDAGVEIHFEDDAAWADRVRRMAAMDGAQASARIRIVAGASRLEQVAAVHDAAEGKPDIAVYGGAVVSAGRVEMLPYLREQAVSITAHRFGTPHHLSDGLL
ncbi:MAG: hypothetical protein R2722_10280 [Tessaracoccus sp.]